jgi:hypothetical protein
MNKVDWSLAPEGATHKDLDEDGLWYKFDYVNNSVHYWSEQFNGCWRPSGTPDDYDDGSIDGMEIRQQPKPWSGPEDGLPPVGEIVEYNGFSLDLKPGSRVEIIHHFSAGVADAAAFIYYKSGGRYVGQAIAAYFKPVCSAADIAAEQRETAIREIMGAAGIDCRVTAARLVDAGFKREVV